MIKRFNIWVTQDARPAGLALAVGSVLLGFMLIGVALGLAS